MINCMNIVCFTVRQHNNITIMCKQSRCNVFCYYLIVYLSQAFNHQCGLLQDWDIKWMTLTYILTGPTVWSHDIDRAPHWLRSCYCLMMSFTIIYTVCFKMMNKAIFVHDLMTGWKSISSTCMTIWIDLYLIINMINDYRLLSMRQWKSLLVEVDRGMTIKGGKEFFLGFPIKEH